MRSSQFTILWSLIAAGACAVRAQQPPAPAAAPPAKSPAISIDTLDVVNHPDGLDLTVTFTSLLDRNHTKDLDGSNVTILAEPSGSRLNAVKPGDIHYAEVGADTVEMLLPLPAAKDDNSLNLCFGVLHFLKGSPPERPDTSKDAPVCKTTTIITQAQAKDLADQLNAAAAKAMAAKTSSEKNIFASGFVTTAQTGTQGGADISLNNVLNNFVPGLAGVDSFLQIQKTSVAGGDPRHFEAGLKWRHVSSFQHAVDTEIENDVNRYHDKGVTPEQLKTFGEEINKAEAKYNPVWLGALEDFAIKIEGDPTQFKAANAVGDGDIQILTRTLPLFGSKKGYFRARPFVAGWEGGRSIGQGAATTTTTGTTTTTTTPDVNWIARAKVGADFTLFYDNSDNSKAKSSGGNSKDKSGSDDTNAKSSLIKRVEISAGGVERYLFLKEINYNTATKSDSTTGKGSRPYFQSDVRVFFAEDGKARYGLRMAYTRGSLPPVFADVKSFQFGFVVETKDEAKTKDDKTKTANGTAK